MRLSTTYICVRIPTDSGCSGDTQTILPSFADLQANFIEETKRGSNTVRSCLILIPEKKDQINLLLHGGFFSWPLNECSTPSSNDSWPDISIFCIHFREIDLYMCGSGTDLQAQRYFLAWNQLDC